MAQEDLRGKVEGGCVYGGYFEDVAQTVGNEESAVVVDSGQNLDILAFFQAQPNQNLPICVLLARNAEL